MGTQYRTFTNASSKLWFDMDIYKCIHKHYWVIDSPLKFTQTQNKVIHYSLNDGALGFHTAVTLNEILLTS